MNKAIWAYFLNDPSQLFIMQVVSAYPIDKKRHFIVFEGLSASGKSTYVEETYQHFLQQGYKAVVIKWNSRRGIKKTVHMLERLNLLTPNLYSILQWSSFFLDYFFKILPLLRKNYVVISDRYFYTGLVRDFNNGVSFRLTPFFQKFFLKPDILYFLETKACVCLDRIHAREKKLFIPGRQQSVKKENNLKWEYSYLEGIATEYEKLISQSELAPRLIRIYPQEKFFFDSTVKVANA